MRALVVHGADDLRLEERPTPTPGPGEALVRVEWGGICGSDLSYWRHGASGTARLRAPMVLGHEFAGAVAAVGDGVDPALVGRAVTVHPARVTEDSVLPARLAGRDNLHTEVRYAGSAALEPHTDGGFREQLTVAATQLRVLPESVSTRSGALAEPLAVALHAVSRAGDVRGRDVLVNGVGAIGALVVAALRRAGAARITAVDISQDSLAVARTMGADETVDVRAGQPLPECEIVFEASGVAAAIEHVLAATARGGTLVQVGNLPGVAAPSTLGALVTREITWIGSFRFAGEMDEAVALLGEGLDVTPIITHEFALEDAVHAFETAAASSGKVMLAMTRAESEEE